MTSTVAGIVKVDPPPITVLPFRYNPEQYLRQRGTAIWEERQVDRGKAVVEYRGVSAHRISLDLFYDALRPQRNHYVRPGSTAVPGDVEEQLRDLHLLALPWVKGDPTSEPPKLQIRYGHGQQIRYVIADLIWNGDIRSDVTGRRVQSDVTVELLEYTSGTPALSPVEKVEQGQVSPYVRPDTPPPSAAAQRTYTVRAGDTLSGIAARELGSAGRFMEIFQLNTPTPLTHPDLIVPGQVLRLPPE